MPPEFQLINPLEINHWDELVLAMPDYSCFHSAAWARVLCESYQYQPHYFAGFDEQGNLSALIPLMEIKSVWTGRRAVSLPFSDYCEPLFAGKIQSSQAMASLIHHGKQNGWKFIEFRHEKNVPEGSHPFASYYGHSLDLTKGEEENFRRLRGSARRNINQALKAGVEVRIEHSLEAIKEYYRLHCLTRKKHGLPPQPFHFFEKIQAHLIAGNLGMVALAFYGGRNIAGAVYFHFGKKALYKFGASDAKYQHLRPNNLVMWEAIKWHTRNGCEHFCFGRTDPENAGLRQFKLGWGTQERLIRYYKYDLTTDAFVQSPGKAHGWHNKIFRRMPVTLLNMVGSLLYKYAG